MSVRRGASFGLIIGQEDAYNDGAASPIGHDIPKVSVGVDSYQGPTLDSPELTDDLNPAPGFEDIFKTDGPIAVAAELNSLGLLNHNFLTGYTVSGASDPYTHTHIPAVADPQPLWMDKGHAHATTPKYDLLYGCYLQGFDVSLSKTGGLCQINWQVFGSGKHTDDGAIPQDATPTAYTGTRLQPKSTIVAIDGTDYPHLTEVGFSASRDIQGDGGMNNLDYHNAIVFGGYTYEISTLSGLWKHASDLRALEDGANHAIRIRVYADATHYIEWLFPEVLIPRRKNPVDGPGAIPYGFPSLKPGFVSAAEGAAMQIRELNATATYATAW